MRLLKKWAKAYEEGTPLVPDKIYDMTVREMIRYEGNYPEIWAKGVDVHPEFKDGSWKYTGTFYRG
jgi:NAD-dependent DNA ligase